MKYDKYIKEIKHLKQDWIKYKMYLKWIVYVLNIYFIGDTVESSLYLHINFRGH